MKITITCPSCDSWVRKYEDDPPLDASDEAVCRVCGVALSVIVAATPDKNVSVIISYMEKP